MGVQASAMGKLILVDPYRDRLPPALLEVVQKVEETGESKIVTYKGVVPVTLSKVSPQEIAANMEAYRDGDALLQRML